MCEASAYLIDGREQRLLMENVDTIEPDGAGLRLVSIFGEQKFVRARIRAVSLGQNKVLLEPAG
ncbi:MAG: CooT family nickel-binding protein [Desulfobacterales bacterium]|jgi:predicted RNA-binding protein|nr:CooT family nickel-binding protein [Desulfobacterales bacterium]